MHAAQASKAAVALKVAPGPLKAAAAVAVAPGPLNDLCQQMRTASSLFEDKIQI